MFLLHSYLTREEDHKPSSACSLKLLSPQVQAEISQKLNLLYLLCLCHPFKNSSIVNIKSLITAPIPSSGSLLPFSLLFAHFSVFLDFKNFWNRNSPQESKKKNWYYAVLDYFPFPFLFPCISSGPHSWDTTKAGDKLLSVTGSSG